MNGEIELFVPGRLCLMGEHSDWAGSYRKNNHEIEKGYAIVTGIEEGIYATVRISDNFVVKFKDNHIEPFISEMDCKKLKEIAEEGGFWSYVAGVGSCIKEQYNVGGIEILINEVSIPVKKGLSSSAAICVLVTRAFNKIYNLHLNTIGEMNIAYQGEIITPSRCGRLDQACAYGKTPILMIFDGDRIEIKNIKIKETLYFVFADLMSQKDTIKILSDLNKGYPFSSTEIEKNVQKCLGSINKENVLKAVECIENGDAKGLGQIMKKAQMDFDKYVMPASYDELQGKVLHKTLNDEFICKLTYGGKGVGSQGDGTVQFLAKDLNSQLVLKDYLETKLNMNAYTLTLEKSTPITKAIIPVAGNGTRMYPMTKVIKKPFLPIIDKNNIVKPSIMCLLEELVEAGIERIALVIDDEEKEIFNNFFGKIDNEIYSKLSKEALEYENKILSIGRKIEYIIQKDKNGLGHAVSLCDKFANGDPVLLLLGDQLYKTNKNESCTKQLLDNYELTNKATVSVCEVNLNSVEKYGIISGQISNRNNYFSVEKMVEKPDISYASENLYTLSSCEKKYYAVFGEYILTKRVFELLKRNVEHKKIFNGEIQITDVLDELAQTDELIAFIPDGIMVDIGTVQTYKTAFMEMMK